MELSIIGVYKNEVENMTQFKKDLENMGYVLQDIDRTDNSFIAYHKTKTNSDSDIFQQYGEPLFLILDSKDLLARLEYDYLKNFFILAQENEAIIQELNEIKNNQSQKYNQLNDVSDNVSALLREKDKKYTEVISNLEHTLDSLSSFEAEDSDFSAIENFVALEEYELEGRRWHQKAFSDYFYYKLNTQLKEIKRVTSEIQKKSEKFKEDKKELVSKIDIYTRLLNEKEQREIQQKQFQEDMAETRKQTKQNMYAISFAILGIYLSFLAFFGSNSPENYKTNTRSWKRALWSWFKKKIFR